MGKNKQKWLHKHIVTQDVRKNKKITQDVRKNKKSAVSQQNDGSDQQWTIAVQGT